ncbi:unnamed protein product [Ranitomeya imitator]|uniref:Uncharacterized protein n=1 Tax=Ranitomeya imitator TaxID=111125 RepID=A0ABN9M3H2_9NEOB|nr:unnamed protein product [Ranitomeya imitator]
MEGARPGPATPIGPDRIGSAPGVTSEEGEIHNLVSEENFVEGVYKLELATKRFWSKVGLSPFHEYV